METTTNPLAPSAIVHAFTEALRSIKGDQRIKYTILKELNQSSLGDINAIYADLNRHLESLHVVPRTHASVPHRAAGRPGERRPGADGQPAAPQPPDAAAAPGGEIDMMAVLQRLASRGFGKDRETRTRIRAPRFYATSCNTARTRYAEISGVISPEPCLIRSTSRSEGCRNFCACPTLLGSRLH